MRCHAVRISETGGPESTAWEEIEVGDPGPGQVLLRQTAVGLNYIDTYHRSGLYPVPLPSGIGLEAAGVVEQLGPDVDDLRDRRSRGLRVGPDRRLPEWRRFRPSAW